MGSDVYRAATSKQELPPGLLPMLCSVLRISPYFSGSVPMPSAPWLCVRRNATSQNRVQSFCFVLCPEHFSSVHGVLPRIRQTMPCAAQTTINMLFSAVKQHHFSASKCIDCNLENRYGSDFPLRPPNVSTATHTRRPLSTKLPDHTCWIQKSLTYSIKGLTHGSTGSQGPTGKVDLE